MSMVIFETEYVLHKEMLYAKGEYTKVICDSV